MEEKICFVCECSISPEDDSIVKLKPKNQNAKNAAGRGGLGIYHRRCWDRSWKGDNYQVVSDIEDMNLHREEMYAKSNQDF